MAPITAVTGAPHMRIMGMGSYRPTRLVPNSEVVDAIDDTGVEFADRGGFDTDDETYGELVDAIITDEIGQGEGANLVIGRHYRARVADWSAATALTVFRRLLELGDEPA